MKDVVAVGLVDVIRELFAHQLCGGGLNLDRNQRKKKSLIDFLLCFPEMLEQTMSLDHVQSPFVATGMIDQETKVFPTFDGLIGTCKSWVYISRDVGIPRELKQHCKDQFQQLAKIQLDVGQISYADMHSVGIP